MGVIKSLDALEPGFRVFVDAFLDELYDSGKLFRIEETLRTKEVQEAYWLQGRAPLEQVNAARAGAGLYLLTEKENLRLVTWTHDSVHFTGRAIDIVPLVKTLGGVVVPWDYVKYADVWKSVGQIGIRHGLEWGGTWVPLNSGGVGKDPPHYQRAA
jgi:hypothetical protein